MITERVLIKDIDELRDFIKLNKKQEEYFNHVMERLRKSFRKPARI